MFPGVRTGLIRGDQWKGWQVIWIGRASREEEDRRRRVSWMWRGHEARWGSKEHGAVWGSEEAEGLRGQPAG